MTNEDAREHFQEGGARYAEYRPVYPAALADWLSELVPDRELAVDVGCGPGQFTKLLAERFERVIATDVSADQLGSAYQHSRIDYQEAGAEALPVESNSASIITAAQAAHWFDLDSFYAEVRRVAKPGAVIALITYQGINVPGALHDPHEAYFNGTSRPYWPSERAYVDAGYETLAFPFDKIECPNLRIEADWSLESILGYMETWSATRRLRAAGQGSLMDATRTAMTAAWPKAEATVPVYWDLIVKAGQL